MITIDGGTGLVTGGTLKSSGSVIQVQQGGSNADSSSSVASQATYDTGIQVSITPSSASNKILIIATISGTTSNGINNFGMALQKKTGSGSFADITAANGADAGNRREAMTSAYQANTYHIGPQSFHYLDTAGSTDELTYRVIYYNVSAYTRTIYINRPHSDSDTNANVRTSSWIQVMEISA